MIRVISARGARARSTAVLLALGLLAGGCSDSPTEPAPEGGGDPTGPAALPGTIVFLSDREFGNTPIGPGRSELYAILPDGTGERQLTDNDRIDNIAALTAADPSGRSVLFERFVVVPPLSTADIMSVDLSGNATAITHNLENNEQDEWVTDPHRLPGSSRIVATAQLGHDLTLYSYAPDGSERSPLIPGSTTIDWKPRPSPSGAWVAFLSQDEWGDPWQCEVVRADGSARRRIDTLPRCETMAWAPDGSRVAFSTGPAHQPEADDDPDSQIWQADADGSNPRVLVASKLNMRKLSSPVFSPDGATLAFVGEGAHPPFRDIFIAGSDGSNPRVLVGSLSNDFSVSFSPDGDYIVFDTYRFGAIELMIAPVDGGDPVRLTYSTQNRNPIWLPER